MDNPEFKYVVTWDGYTTGHDAGYSERKLCGVANLDEAKNVVVAHRDAMPRVYCLMCQEELSSQAILDARVRETHKEQDERKVALAKLTERERQLLRIVS